MSEVPDKACILFFAGTELTDVHSLDIIVASSPGKEIHDP